MKKRGTIPKKAQKSFEKAKPKVKSASTATKKKIEITKAKATVHPREPPINNNSLDQAFSQLDEAIESAVKEETIDEYNARINRLKAEREGLL